MTIVSGVSPILAPNNYKKIDEFVSRSAQPLRENFIWLKADGITDVVNFRTMYLPHINFKEDELAESLNIKYHAIPTISAAPTEQNVNKFFELIENIRNSKNNKKIHIHCKAGADRTGLYALLYKTRYNIGTFQENIQEMLDMGHDAKRFPNIIDFAKGIIKSFGK